MSEFQPGFLCCSLLARELEVVSRRLGLEGSQRVFFESNCHLASSQDSWPPPRAQALLEGDKPVLALCMNCKRPSASAQAASPISGLEHPGLQVIEVQTQGELFLGQDATERALAEGAFIVLPGWLACWRSIIIDSWGFDAATAPIFFGEAATRLVFLDTGVEGPWERELSALAAFVGLPCEHRFVGLSHLEALVRCASAACSQRSERRSIQAAAAQARALAAEYATVVDFITSLGSLPSEAAIIASLEGTAQILFAAQQVCFLPHDPENEAAQGPASFEVAVTFAGERLGMLAVHGIALPEHRARYLPMAAATCDAAGIALNATRLVERERSLARQLEQKVVELDQFAYVASHDLQAPLRRLVSFAELLESTLGEQLPPRAVTYLDHIQRNAVLMRTLVQDLLRLSRASNSPLRAEPVQLDLCLDRALMALGSSTEERGAVVERRPLPGIVGDPGLLSQLFQNLLGNALKFVPADRSPVVVVSADREDQRWVICVQDNGIGIEPQHAETIFAPFQRLHRSHEYDGSGIGLSICRRVVERHGGEIWVQPGDAQGSIFRFSLPVVAT